MAMNQGRSNRGKREPAATCWWNWTAIKSQWCKNPTSSKDWRHDDSLGESVSQETDVFHKESLQSSIFKLHCSNSALRTPSTQNCEGWKEESILKHRPAAAMWCQRNNQRARWCNSALALLEISWTGAPAFSLPGFVFLYLDVESTFLEPKWK